ncbi:response regulator [Flavobacterium agrisoli]|uniref:Response regulator transcription factor n=1 Tax=Flavobacterium agrisoli TaxID=2793066 RepID=A0A934PM92_9FLAO|nr:response regulator [Flavobacterium agrisoli]MBK0369425.1 response regulator transcription factor [Flavobacterium agrisoli]
MSQKTVLETQNKRILIVDDHPFIIEGYKNAITRYKPEEFEFEIVQAKDCESAYKIITNSRAPFDIAFLDISMPAFEEMNLYSGADVAKLILQKMPNCKVVLLTMFTELLKIKTFIREINPLGLIIKNDLTFDELLLAFNKVINNELYYSESVLKILERSQNITIELDQFDREILFHLSKGTPLGDFAEYIPISTAAINRRLQDLKQIFDIKSGLDADLVQAAKSKGFI